VATRTFDILANDGMAFFKKKISEMTAKKSCAASDQDSQEVLLSRHVEREPGPGDMLPAPFLEVVLKNTFEWWIIHLHPYDCIS